MRAFFFFTFQMDFLCPSNWIICFPQSRTVEKASEYFEMNFFGASSADVKPQPLARGLPIQQLA